MFKEFERIVLTKNLPERNLVKGDVGTIVDSYENGRGYEVEFITLSGETVSVKTLCKNDIRQINPKAIVRFEMAFDASINNHCFFSGDITTNRFTVGFLII